MTKVFRYALATALWGAALGGCGGTANASMVLSMEAGTVSAVNPVTHTIEIGHRRCQVAANASGDTLNSGWMVLNLIHPGTAVHYIARPSGRHGCTIIMLQPVTPAHRG